MFFRRFPVRSSAVLAAVLAWASQVAVGQQQLLQKNYDTQGATRLEVRSVFSTGVCRGYLPVRVTIRNGTVLDRSWSLDFSYSGGWNEMAYRSRFSVAAGAGQEVVRELLVPVPTAASGGTYYQQLEVRAGSPGLPSEQNFHSSNLNADWPALAISKGLAERNLGALDGKVSSTVPGTEHFAGSFETDELPADWRAYTGFDALLITEEEWDGLAPGTRQAILEWTRLGGSLELYTSAAEAGSILPRLELGGERPDPGLVRRGLGQVRAWTWNGRDLDAEKTVARYRGMQSLTYQLREDYRGGWRLLNLFGEKDFNPLLVVLLLIAFAVVVGPVNLFVLAKPGRRHRLFITTPIISLVASLLILLLILFGDGIGGAGRRIVLANLVPTAAEKRLYVVQEQVSRTGVLLGSAFEAGEPGFLSPVLLPPSQWNRMLMSNSPLAAYSFDGQVYRGDWFKSRSEQGHYYQTVLPTRSRIELQAPSPDGKTPPRLFSSLEFTVSELFYRDDLGVVWRAAGDGPIAGGQAIELEPVDFSELSAWWKRRIDAFSQSQRKRAAELWKNDGHFFAVSSDPKAGFVDTLDAIRWWGNDALIYGPVQTAPAPAAPTPAAQ